MASNGHITAEQLQRVVEAIMNKVLKINVMEDGNIATAEFGNLYIAYSRLEGDSSLFITDLNTKKSIVIDLDQGGTESASKVIVSGGNGTYIEHLSVGTLSRVPVQGLGSGLRYCLPDSTPDSRSQAMHPNTGGGILLSTRYRAYEPLIYTPDPDQGASVVAKPYMFTTVSGATAVNISFEEEVNAVNEYWIDLEFLNTVPPSVTFRDFNGGKSIVWTGDGEPDWSTLGGRRIQIHILSGMASYVISSATESRSDENVEPTE